VTFHLGFRAFAYYHPAYARWIAEDGDFDLLVGSSAADLRGRTTVTLQSTGMLPCILNRESTLGDWLDDPRGRVALEPYYDAIIARMRARLGGAHGGTGMEVLGFLRETALLSVLHFQESSLSQTPEALLEELLAQVHAASDGHVPAPQTPERIPA
jgi:beta-glucosidase